MGLQSSQVFPALDESGKEINSMYFLEKNVLFMNQINTYNFKCVFFVNFFLAKGYSVFFRTLEEIMTSEIFRTVIQKSFFFCIEKHDNVQHNKYAFIYVKRTLTVIYFIKRIIYQKYKYIHLINKHLQTACLPCAKLFTHLAGVNISTLNAILLNLYREL